MDIYNLILDRDLRVIKVGPNVVEKLRYKEEDFVGKSFLEVIYPVDRDSFEEFLHQSRSGCICSIRLIDRTDRVLYSKIKFTNKDDFYFLRVEIIPSALEELDDLRWQLEIHQKGLEMIGAGLIFTDMDGVILYVSRSAERILKLMSRHIIGRNINEFVTMDNVEFIPTPSREGEINEVRFNFRGKTLYLGYHSEYVSTIDGRVAGYLMAFMEISELKRLQQEQARIDKLASLGILASGIAHEIRNPLAGIKAMAQTIQNELPPDDPNHVYVERIIKQVNRLDTILKAFFAYARPKIPYRTEVDLKEVMSDIEIMLKHQVEKKNIKLKVNIPSKLPYVLVDKDQLQQILINLILNSIDAVDKDHGLIEVKARRIASVPGKNNGNKSCSKNIQNLCGVEIIVKDNGCGIDPGVMDKIFDPFFTTKPKGTGLGLSIVHQLVTENCGEIYVNSYPGRGTKFTLKFQGVARDKMSKE